MALLARCVRFAACAWALCLLIAVAVPAAAQQEPVNPTASSVKEQQLLQQLKRIQGR
jgi:formate dehydrogenase subunit gamma